MTFTQQLLFSFPGNPLPQQSPDHRLKLIKRLQRRSELRELYDAEDPELLDLLEQLDNEDDDDSGDDGRCYRPPFSTPPGPVL